MSRLVAISRVIALIGMTVLFCVAFICQRVFLVGRPERIAQLTDQSIGRWARTTQRIIGMRVHVDGKVPNAPVMLVSNHLSYIDIVALWSVMPAVFVARADIANWPLIGQVCRLIGTILIDRTRKRDLLRVIPEMESLLAAGRNIIFFPEGTSSRGAEVLPFKSPLFEAAARQSVPIVSASLSFETKPPAPSADQSICWWGDMNFSPHTFALLRIPSFDARIKFSSLKHTGKDRKELRRLALESVETTFNPTSLDSSTPSPSDAEGAQ